MHILLMAGIMNGNNVSINGIGIVPIICMSHVPVLPSLYRWLTA
jgi:hypothetical protein